MFVLFYAANLGFKFSNTITSRLFTHIVSTEKMRNVKIREIVKIQEVPNVLTLMAVFRYRF